jgi:hypothetical protein
MKQKMLVGLVLLSALAAQEHDRFTVKVPNGLAFSEFRGYEAWQYVAASVTDDRVKIIGGIQR